MVCKGKGRPITWLCRHREEAEVWLHPILNPAVEGSGWSAPPFGRHTSRKYQVSIVQEDGWALVLIRGSSSPQGVAMPTTLSQPPSCGSSFDRMVPLPPLSFFFFLAVELQFDWMRSMYAFVQSLALACRLVLAHQSAVQHLQVYTVHLSTVYSILCTSAEMGNE